MEGPFKPHEKNTEGNIWTIDRKFKPPETLSKKPPEFFGNKIFEMGDGGDEGKIKLIKVLIEKCKNTPDAPKKEGSEIEKIDFRTELRPEIRQIITLINSLEKNLEGAQGVIVALKVGDVMPLDDLLNPRSAQAPTEL